MMKKGKIRNFIYFIKYLNLYRFARIELHYNNQLSFTNNSFNFQLNFIQFIFVLGQVITVLS